ncbi:prepilin-type N-terminal cleavage/methylation domain-containing protein [Haloferula sp. BvORR071]|uniref:PilW family protein n=1 Tax=Haloferula sp. BvORR071 TaxID=1396141 RepID=UPI000553A858|nr:prepilin-type N-terminal cleavage/methylation domain-containing protein [Haloferula sp. BvORR071]
MKLPRHSRGFTLIELLVTMAIGSVILFVAALMLSKAGEGYDHGAGSVAAEREARAILHQMGSDLAKAEWHKDTRFKNDGADWIKADLGFFSLQPEDAQSESKRSADLCAVHYYLQDITVGNATIRCLMRGFRESGEVFPALKTGSLDPLFTPEKTDEPVAFGVLSFEAQPLQRSKAGQWENWNGDKTKAPTAVRLRLVVARRELLGKLTTAQDWNSSPLRGVPGQVANNPNLETYEAIQRYGNDA